MTLAPAAFARRSRATRPNRRPHHLVSAVAAWCMMMATAGLRAQGDNVLILVADDLGVDSVASYGEGTTPPPTPNIDALARRGVLFRNAWANPTCTPTRACIHTGRHAFRTGVGHTGVFSGRRAELSLDEITLPEVLDMAGSGYAHAAIGKWHLGTTASGPATPNASGWSHFAGLLGGQANYFEWPRTVDGVTRVSTTYATTQFVDDTLTWIRQQTGRWVCYVAFTAPHTPFHVPPAALHTASLTPSPNPRPFYEAMVEALDTEIGRLLAALGPELARTNVIFLGDNGAFEPVVLPPFVPCHGKGRPYEGGVNVPLIVAGPAVAAPGREEPALVSVVDLFATVSELAGVDARSTVPAWVMLDSVSLVPYLTSSAHVPLRNTVFCDGFIGTGFTAATESGFVAIRDSRYKLIRFQSALLSHPGVPPLSCTPTGPFPAAEFFDLQQDPFELNNLLPGPLTPAQQQGYDALDAALSTLHRPPGRLVVFGSADCVGVNGNPAIGGSGTPTLGGSYGVRLRAAAPVSPAVLLIGQSATSWAGLTLPLELAPFGAGPNCRLYTSTEVGVPTATDASGSATASLQVPVWSSLVGRTLFHSWAVVDAAAPSNPLGITTSNGAAAAFGLQGGGG